MVKVAFSVDDVAAKQGYGLEQQQGQLGLLYNLHQTFGCKFDLFTIPNFEGQADITEHEEFSDWLNSQDYFNVQAHGLYHKNPNPQHAQKELADRTPQEFNQVIEEGKILLEKAGFAPKIFKAPGWAFPHYGYQLLEDHYSALADHMMSDQTFELGNGLTLIPYTLLGHQLHSTHYDNFIVIHTHINPQGGQIENGFTPNLVNYISDYLEKLESEKEVEYVFMEDLF